MNEIKDALRQVEEINERYGLSNEPIEKFLDGMDKELLCVPIIGAFSSGKTAVINTLLGYSRKILVEDITPETAIPAEIQYRFDPRSAETVRIAYSDGHDEGTALVDYVANKRDGLDAGRVASVRLNLDNRFFGTIRRVMLVDMPGFGSGDDVHDRAINNYAANSMAYIVTFPADDLVLRNEVGDILKELCVINKPVCAMITKSDKAPPPEDFKAAWGKLKENLAKYIGNREIKWLETCGKEGKVEDLKTYLLELQERSEALLHEQKFLPFFAGEASKTLIYLRERLDKSSLSESELEEQKERLETELKRFMDNVAKLTQTFRKDTEQCPQEIVNDVQAALHANLPDYVSMAMNNTDERRISECINSTVRVAANQSAQQRFLGKARQYVENVNGEVKLTDCLVAGIPTVRDEEGPDIGKTVSAAAVGGVGGAVAGTVAASLVPGALGGLAALGGSIGLAPIVMGSLTIPVVGVAIAIVGAIAGLLGGLFSGDKKRAEARAALNQQFVSQVFPSVIQQLLPCVKTALAQKTDEICAAIEQQVQERVTPLEKALEDCRVRQADEEEESGRVSAEIRAHIAAIEERVKIMGEPCHAI